VTEVIYNVHLLVYNISIQHSLLNGHGTHEISCGSFPKMYSAQLERTAVFYYDIISFQLNAEI